MQAAHFVHQQPCYGVGQSLSDHINVRSHQMMISNGSFQELTEDEVVDSIQYCTACDSVQVIRHLATLPQADRHAVTEWRL